VERVGVEALAMRARTLLWVPALLALAAPAWLRAPLDARPSLVERVLGPFADTLASIQWVRADVAWRHGQVARGFELAASALDLAPSASGGWIFLARHCVYERASPERESDPAVRRQWVRAAFDVLARGEAHGVRGGALAFERGLILLYLAQVAGEPDVPESERPWPGAPSTLFEAAARAFDQSLQAGDAAGADAAQSARARARGLRAQGR
jgi:hypothetical protein